MRQSGRFHWSFLLIIMFVVLSGIPSRFSGVGLVLAGAGPDDSNTPAPTPQSTVPTVVPSPTPTPREVISEVQIMTLPAIEQPTKESEEAVKSRNIINDPEVRRLLKQSPDFIYNPGDLKDPMIVPWIRNTILIKEYIQSLQKLIKEHQVESAKVVINRIKEVLPEITEPDVSKEAEAQIALANQEIMKMSSTTTEAPGQPGVSPIETPIIIMPSWIESHVSGVIWQPKAEERTVLIGDDILKEGEKIPRYPDAVVQKINPTSVVISYRGLVKEISVIGGETE